MMQPNAWLKELAHVKPARWRWGRSVRSALGMGIPLAVGLYIDNIGIVLFVALGALQQGIAERDAPYIAIYKKVMIAAPIGALSFLLGYLSELPWIATVIVMAGVAFMTAIVSSYSAPLSSGCLQLLTMGAVFIGLPELAPYWPSALLLLLGALLYIVLLSLEVLLCRHSLDREVNAELLRGLADLADQRLDDGGADARQRVTDQLNMLYGVLLQRRRHALGPNAHLDQEAAWLQRADALFALLMSASDKDSLSATARQLRVMADAYAKRARPPQLSSDPAKDSALASGLAQLAQALWGDGSVTVDDRAAPAPASLENRMSMWLDRLTPGRSVVQSALALALCTALAYSVYWFDNKTHWYWVPMTVCIVMKPDMGSIFVRAVHRSLGTSVGVLLGSAILAWMHPGLFFVAVMMAIAATLPWLAQQSYALMALGLTPLVLVLIEFSSAASKDIDYAVLRLAYTLLGAAIVLVFGYLIWPRSHKRQLVDAFSSARQKIGSYLSTAVAQATIESAPEVRICRRQAYGAISNIRTTLQQSLGEPPPAGREAAAWFPIISSAARICDAITAYSSQPQPAPSAQDVQLINALARDIATASTDTLRQIADEDVRDTSPETRLIKQIRSELIQYQPMVADA